MPRLPVATFNARSMFARFGLNANADPEKAVRSTCRPTAAPSTGSSTPSRPGRRRGRQRHLAKSRSDDSRRAQMACLAGTLSIATIAVARSGSPARSTCRRPTSAPSAATTANLALASLQVESLAGLAAATAAFLAGGGKLSDPHFDAARRAGNVLGRFYGAVRTIYRSHSPKAQIDDGGPIADINAMRAALGMEALFAPA